MTPDDVDDLESYLGTLDPQKLPAAEVQSAREYLRGLLIDDDHAFESLAYVEAQATCLEIELKRLRPEREHWQRITQLLKTAKAKLAALPT